MDSLGFPVTTSSEAFRASVNTIRDKDDRELYMAFITPVVNACHCYDDLGRTGSFDTAQLDTFSISGLAGDKMEKLYNSQFRQGTRTRKMRDALINSAPHKVCPYCGIGQVSELDHYLPKSSFHATTVYPGNLVPCCKDCNSAKNAYIPNPNKPAVLHPYFDKAFNQVWLRASLCKDSLGTPVARFQVHLAAPNSKLQSRLQAHLRVFGLYDRFSNKASQLLEDFERLCTEIELQMDLVDAQQYLKSAARSGSASRANRWETATYLAILDSDWYLQDYLQLQ